MNTQLPRALHSMLPPCCYNCGATDGLEWHHIIPRSLGGKDIMSNLVPLCYDCHSRLHSRIKNDNAEDLSTLIKQGIEKRRANGLQIGRTGIDKEPVYKLIAEHLTLFKGGSWTEQEIMDRAQIKRTLFHECIRELCADLESGEWNHAFPMPERIREKPLHAKSIMAMRRKENEWINSTRTF